MPSILTDLSEEEPISFEKLTYIRARARLRLHDFILHRFQIAQDQGINQATIARRLGKSPAQVSHQLGVPGNWTIDTVADLAAAMGGEIDFLWVPLRGHVSRSRKRNGRRNH
ncbi:MAG TPA: hypothetical protein VFE56_09725 [Candidatus Binataceae bacterium]|nr:hypothetical protein [Candidatus Binataceae bacterium]